MDIHTLYIIAYATSTTSCLGSCAILLFLNYGNIETNPVYLKARRILAFATFLVAIGLLISLTTRKWQPVGWDIASFPVTLIASSQTLLFTFSLILLFNEQYATRQRILLHATPSLLFTLAYAGACLIWKDHPVYAYSEWKSLVTNPPSLIRTLYLLAYIIQSGIYAKLFLHERHTYLSLLGGVKTEDRWLKLGQVTSAFFLASGIGLCTLSLAPSQVTARVAGGIEVNLKEETAYPFEETVRYHVSFTDKKVKKVFFPFHLRIPGWCKQPVVKLNGKPLTVDAYPGTVTRINREWKEGDILSLELPMEVTVSRWYENSAVVERGPLVYALKMNEKWEKKAFESDKSDVYGKWYYEVTSDSPWNYALPARSFSPDRIKDAFTVEKSDITTPYPWNVENAPIRIKTKAMRLNGWTQVRGSAGPVPYYTQQGKDFGDEETIELIPYGCTTLRITEFPVR